MTSEGPVTASASAGLIDRVKNILLTPQAEWDKIAAEPTDVKKLYIGYAVPLAALGAIAMTVGMLLFRFGAFGVYFRYSPVQAVVSGVTQFIVTLACIYVMGIIINALAPTFGSRQDQGEAHKLAVYSWTASLLAMLFAIHPALAILGLLGLYSFFLLYIGLPRIMKTPEDKRIGYFITIIVIGIVVSIVTGVVVGTVRGAVGGFAAPFSVGANSSSEGRIEINGGSVDLGELERAAKQIEQAYGEGGQGQAAITIDPMQLQALLPESLPGGFTRTSISNASAGGGMAGAAGAEAEYTRGDARISIDVVHLGGLGGLASMATAMNVQSNREDENGYERVRTVDGRTVTESVNRASNSATYGVIGRNGATVTAEGTGVTVEELRAAVDAVGVGRVEDLGV